MAIHPVAPAHLAAALAERLVGEVVAPGWRSLFAAVGITSRARPWSMTGW
jgi:hypothetical protein